ncbi:MAG: MBL fold metallo-hydrolase [Dehalococcoidia bacterium]
MGLELTFIGTGNGFAPARYYSSFLANNRFLFDASPPLMPHLKKLGKDPGDIEVVFISHFHADHYFGLPFLMLEYAELAPRTKELTIVGPPGIGKRLQSVTDLAFPNVFRKDRGYLLRFIEAGDGKSGEAAGCTFVSREVPHVPGIQAFGFRATFDGRTIAYSGDTVMCDALVPLADGADVFVVECSCWDEKCGPHLSPKDILELRRRISPSTTFILTHMGAGQAPAALTDAGILVADDLKTIVV